MDNGMFRNSGLDLKFIALPRTEKTHRTCPTRVLDKDIIHQKRLAASDIETLSILKANEEEEEAEEEAEEVEEEEEEEKGRAVHYGTLNQK
jgi:hypothetical protein